MNEIKKRFAHLVIHYRKMVEGWNQKELADKSNLPMRTISDIENAKKAVLDYETISKLAAAFAIEGNQLVEFFQTAGLDISEEERLKYEWLSTSFNFYRDTKYPAFSFNPLGGIQSVNSYILQLLRYETDILSPHLLNHPLGLNIVRFFIDPAFGTRSLFKNQWAYYTKLQLWFFKNISRSSVYSRDYLSMLGELQKFDDFQSLWGEIETFEPPSPPYSVTIHTQKFGKAHYLHAELFVPKYDHERVVFYIPLDPETENVFGQIVTHTAKAAYRLDNSSRQVISQIL